MTAPPQKTSRRRADPKALSSLVEDFGAKLGPWAVRSLAHRSVFGRPDERDQRSLLLRLAEPAARVEGEEDPLGSIPAGGYEIKSQKRERRHVGLAHELDDVEGLAALLKNDLVASVTVPRPVRAMLAPAKAAPPKGLRGFADIRCEAQHFPPGAVPLDGRSIVIGIIDYGCDYTHPALRDGDATRLLALWDQNAPAGPGAGFTVDASPFHGFTFDYGAQYGREEIQGWLSGAAKPAYDPHAHYFSDDLQWGAHGTYVASIAAGSTIDAIGVLGSSEGAPPPPQPTSLSFRGVAPAAPLIFVQLAITNQDWSDSFYGTPTFRQYSDSHKLSDAVHYVYAKALELKFQHGQAIDGVVINLSVGTWGGAHDGRSTAERAIDEIVAEVNSRPDLPPLSVVIGAGNAGHLWNHDMRTIAPGGSAEFRWRMMRGDGTPNELEIWYRGADSSRLLEAEIGPPGSNLDDPGAPRFSLPAAGHVLTLNVGGQDVGYAIHVPTEDGRPNHIDIVVDPRAGPELNDPSHSWCRAAWTVRLKNASDAPEMLVHSWIERDDVDDVAITSFQGLLYRLDPYQPAVNPRSTLSSLACGRETIVVSGYNQARASPSRTDAWFATSQGPAPWNADGSEPMPEVCAPAHNVLGAASKTGAFFAQSGTSAAAPHVAGAVALFLQAAARDGHRPSSEEVRTCLQNAAKARRRQVMTNWPADRDWDAQRGFGPLDVAGFVALGAQRA
jgi:subtilisin family serine protease